MPNTSIRKKRALHLETFFFRIVPVALIISGVLKRARARARARRKQNKEREREKETRWSVVPEES